jgi:ABC-type sugar transport system substrate-binding protein
VGERVGRLALLALIALVAALAVGCGDDDDDGGGEGSGGAATAETEAKIDADCDASGAQVAVIPHFKSPFTQQFIEGGEAAAADCNATVKSAGPDAIDTPVQIRQFNDLVTTGSKAIVTVAYPSNLWVRPIDQAVDQGVEVGTVDVASPKSKQLIMAAPKQTDFGRALGDAAVEALGPDAEGEIVTGICFPGLDVLEQRLVGFREVIERELPNITVAKAVDTTFDPAKNFTAWQRLMQQNPDAIAVAGVCDGDASNLLKVRKQTADPSWTIVAQNYDPIALGGVADGDIAALVGAQPFMQGYTAMRTLLTKIAGGDVPRGWIDTGTETVTQANVEEVTAREESIEQGYEQSREFYSEQIDEIFGDLPAHVKPFEEYLQP